MYFYYLCFAGSASESKTDVCFWAFIYEREREGGVVDERDERSAGCQCPHLTQ